MALKVSPKFCPALLKCIPVSQSTQDFPHNNAPLYVTTPAFNRLDKMKEGNEALTQIKMCCLPTPIARIEMNFLAMFFASLDLPFFRPLGPSSSTLISLSQDKNSLSIILSLETKVASQRQLHHAPCREREGSKRLVQVQGWVGFT